ncbi:MAG: hypothetical protein IJR82_00580 [Bacilli bacterium]|nr:hypothetical protein [Bacilli bacterium]
MNLYNENLDIDTTNDEEGSSSGRGAKGSYRDRIISFILRNRYKDLRLQPSFYTKANLEKKIDYIRELRNFDIDKIRNLDQEDKSSLSKKTFVMPIEPLKEKTVDFDIPKIEDSVNPLGKGIEALHAASEKISDYEPQYEINDKAIEFDPNTEVFDFDKYDYFIMDNLKRGLDIKDLSDDEKEIVDLDNEEKLAEDEKVIVEEIEKFIDESLVTLSEIKDDVAILQVEVEKPYTIEQVEKIEEKHQEVRTKIDKLKSQYDTVKEKYDFEDFAILDSIEIMDAVDDYLDRAKLDTIEVMVNVCKNEIDKIDGIVIEKNKSVKVSADIEDKREEIEVRTIAFEKNRDETHKQERVEDRVAIELNEQRKILNDIKSRVNVIENVNVPRIQITGYGRMFASFLRVAAGILTVPLSNRRIFGVALGAAMINRGLRGLRRGLTVEQRHETYLKYEDLEREIINCKDKLQYTNLMLLDSIEQVNGLKKEFSEKFEKYVYLIPEYKEAMDKLDNLKKNLEQKHIEVKAIEKDLDMQRTKNKQKMKKVA